MIKVIQREINLFLWGGLLMWRRPLLKGSSRPVETVTLNSDSGSTFVVHQICSFLMPWVLPLFYGWPFWCENMSLLTTEPSAHVNKTACLLLFVLGCGLHNASSLNRWTVVYYHVIGSHLCFLLLELRADAGMFLRDFHTLSHRTGLRKLLEFS